METESIMTQVKQKIQYFFDAVTRRTVSAMLLCTLTILLFAYLGNSRNIFIIVDDNRMSLHQTYTNDAMLALREAGVTLGSDDLVELPASPVAGAAQVVIVRSHDVTVRADGKAVSLPSRGETVGTVLQKAGVRVGVRDEVTPDPSSPTAEGMEIVVSRVNTQTVSVEEEIPFETVRKASIYINKGTENVKQAGQKGKRLSTYTVTLKNGEEVERKLISQQVVSQPVNALIEYGSGGTITTKDGTVLRYKRVIDVKATAYTTEGYADKTNALGRVARPGTIAVDPRIIPMRSKVYVTSQNAKGWVYGTAVCEDTGGAIKGNIVDLFFSTRAECFSFGRRSARVYILE